MLGTFPVATSAKTALHEGHAAVGGEMMAHDAAGPADPSRDGTPDHDLTCELACVSIPTPDLFLVLDPPVTLVLDLAHPAGSDARPGRDPDPAARPPKLLPV